MVAIAELQKCQWVSEKVALTEFPFSKDKLSEMREDGRLQYKVHWKHVDSRNQGRGRGRSSAIIYHRARVNQYLDSL